MTFKKFLTVSLFTAAIALPVASYAQYVGPSDTTTPTSVENVLVNAQDDAQVVLEGHILRSVGDEKYIFSDGTGEITVEIDDDDFPGTIGDKTRVQIRGEVDKDRDGIEIDVDAVVTLQ